MKLKHENDKLEIHKKMRKKEIFRRLVGKSEF